MATSQVGRPSFKFSILKPLNETSIKIKIAKFKNLLTLLDYIPPIHHPFYKNIKHDGSAASSKKGKQKQSQTVSLSQKEPDFDQTQRRPDDSEQENDENDIAILNSDYE